MAFASDMSYLYVAIKGKLPTDLNNPTGKQQPGAIYAYAISDDMTLDQDPTMTAAAIPFSIVEDKFNGRQYRLRSRHLRLGRESRPGDYPQPGGCQYHPFPNGAMADLNLRTAGSRNPI